MLWSSETPTTPGWYWFNFTNVDWSDEPPFIRHVILSRNISPGQLVCITDKGSEEILDTGVWLGPLGIPIPRGPTGLSEEEITVFAAMVASMNELQLRAVADICIKMADMKMRPKELLAAAEQLMAMLPVS